MEAGLGLGGVRREAQNINEFRRSGKLAHRSIQIVRVANELATGTLAHVQLKCPGAAGGCPLRPTVNVHAVHHQTARVHATHHYARPDGVVDQPHGVRHGTPVLSLNRQTRGDKNQCSRARQKRHPGDDLVALADDQLGYLLGPHPEEKCRSGRYLHERLLYLRPIRREIDVVLAGRREQGHAVRRLQAVQVFQNRIARVSDILGSPNFKMRVVEHQRGEMFRHNHRGGFRLSAYAPVLHRPAGCLLHGKGGDRL